MATKSIKATETGDLESRVAILEARVAVLEQSAKKVMRKKKEYTDEQRAAIRQRFLKGQEETRKRRGGELIAEVIVKPEANIPDDVEVIKPEKPKESIKSKQAKNKVAKIISSRPLSPKQ